MSIVKFINQFVKVLYIGFAIKIESIDLKKIVLYSVQFSAHLDLINASVAVGNFFQKC